MYDIYDHGRMIADRVRGDAYARAIAATVRPDDIVVDLGTGTGIFAVLACGPAHDGSTRSNRPVSSRVAREIAAANRCLDRIEFRESDSRKIDLKEKANV